MSITINGENTNKITFKQREAKTLKFTYNCDINSASFYLIVRDSQDNIVIQKTDSDFDKSQKANGIVRVTLTKEDLDYFVSIAKHAMHGDFVKL